MELYIRHRENNQEIQELRQQMVEAVNDRSRVHFSQRVAGRAMIPLALPHTTTSPNSQPLRIPFMLLRTPGDLRSLGGVFQYAAVPKKTTKTIEDPLNHAKVTPSWPPSQQPAAHNYRGRPCHNPSF